jgi:hypothetical protein
MRHPFDLGGVYYCFNAIMSMLSVLVSAVLYSLYVPAATVGDVLGAGFNGTDSNGTLELRSSTNHTAANSTNTNLSLVKIDDFTLTVSVAALVIVWVISAAGLLHTIKRKFLRTFVSTQTGCDYARSFFLDHEGNDAVRVNIFLFNERQWRSIRDRVREWVRNAYAVWEQLRPTWFNESLQMRIPDDFMPAQVVMQLNAQAPGGRRKTLAGMGLLRRVTLTAGTDVLVSEATCDSAFVINMPSPEAAQSATFSIAAAISAATPLNIEVGTPMLSFVKPSDCPKSRYNAEYQAMPEVPQDETNADSGIHSDNRHSRIEPMAASGAGLADRANLKLVDLESI